MKNLIKILIALVAFSNIVLFAQDNVDLRAKVKEQINQVQANSSVVTKADLESESIIFPNISPMVFRILIFLLGSIIVFALVFLRRVKIKHKMISLQFKENIRLIREESLKQPINYTLTPVRKGLLEKIETCLEDKTISNLARKLNIAKGEIMLVNNIRSYASNSGIYRS
jgi:hypothetical protein